MSTEDLEQFYNDTVAALREDLLKVSGMTLPIPPQLRDTLKGTEEQPEERPTSNTKRRMIPYNPRSAELKAIAQSLPAFQSSHAGFQLVDVARLGKFALIAFRWHETGDQIFVYIRDLHSFAVQSYGVDMSTVIISTNLLEQLGGQWHHHHSPRIIKGLAFME